MALYKVILEQKDYGNGPHCYRTYVEADSSHEAEEKAMRESRHCGIESADAFLVK